MDIQFFQTFLMVAKLGNMTQTAEQLNFTQPTVTGQIRTLEQHFGVMLFDRVGKKLYITDAGRELMDYAERLLTTYDEAQKALSVHPGNINLGIATTSVNYILVPFLQEFQQQAPKCSVAMEMCLNTTAVVKGIVENRFDLGFITQNVVSLDYLIGFEVYKEQLVWVVHPKLAEKFNYSTNILDYPLLVYKAGGLFRTIYEKALGRKKFAPTIEYGESETMKNAILQGLGCGALPMIMIKQLL
ncbi:MAG: transcriptional regulator, LysR family, partial [Anaerosporomusa subterranea]|nr:transcriptional regulator, LysR family [Anaerosporomusa subterranea]